MKKLVLVFILFANVGWCSAQVTELEELYTKYKYEKCVKKCENLLSSNSKDMEALLFQALSFCQLWLDPKMEQEFKDGAEKACRLIEKLKRIDKDRVFSKKNKKRFLELEQLELNCVKKHYENKKIAKQVKLLDLMVICLNSNYARYHKWKMLTDEEQKSGNYFELLNDAAKDIYESVKQNEVEKAYLPELFADLAINISVKTTLEKGLFVLNQAIDLFKPSSYWAGVRKSMIEEKINKLKKTYINRWDAINIITACESIQENDNSYKDFQSLRNDFVDYLLNDAARLNETDNFSIFIKMEIDRMSHPSGRNESFLKSLLFGFINSKTDLSQANNVEICKKSIFYLHVLNDLLKSNKQSPELIFEQELTDRILKEVPENAFKLLVNLKILYPKNKNLELYDPKILDQNRIALEKSKDFAANLSHLQCFLNLYPKDTKLLQMKNSTLESLVKQNIALKKYSEAGFFLNEALKDRPNNPSLLFHKKQWVVDDYKENYKTTEVSIAELEWTGDTFNCTSGTVSELAQTRLIQRLNYIRRLAGIPDKSELRPEFNQKCQEAALIMSANNELSHFPPKTWKCFSDNGLQAAAKSNLSWSSGFYNSTSALIGQVFDDGSGNYSVGHRRWILNPSNKVFGHGSTKNTMSLWCLGGMDCYYPNVLVNPYKYQPICWPVADYMPESLIPIRWSFGLIDANFSKAEIGMKENGKPIKVKLELLSNGYGVNTIVWVPQTSGKKVQTVYEISVKKVILSSGELKSFTYKVIPIEIK